MAENKTPQNDRGDPSTDPGQTLRRRAEERLKQQSPARVTESPGKTGRLLHELQVHQVELEMQNEELRRAQQELEASMARYFDLYDLAPVGYLTLNEKGLILEANLTASQMLGVDRNLLAWQPLSRFIHRDDQEIFYLCQKQLFEKQTPTTCDLRMVQNSGLAFYVQMAMRVADDSGGAIWRATLSDVTALKEAEEALGRVNRELESRVLERTADLDKEIVERKGAEELLRQSEKQLRYLSTKILTTQEAERKRIAGELHDGLAASLSALKFSVENIFNQMEPDEHNLSRAKGLVTQIQRMIEETRRIMADLRPSVLDDLGIIPAIQWFCREFQKTYSGLVIEFRIDIAENKVPESLRSPIFRIVQEALNNIAKHSRSTSVHLTLGNDAEGIELVIRDNGQGFDLERKTMIDDSRTGLGLASMRERAALSGGTFTIHSEKGTGTTIRVLWPCASPA